MNADNQALNDSENVDTSLEAGGSPNPEIQLSDEELVSTLDVIDADPEGANNTGDPTDDKDKEALLLEGKDKEDKPDEGDTRYDKDPRWIKNREDTTAANERAIRAEAKLEALEQAKQPQGLKDQEKDYTDISTMSDEEMRNMLEESPKDFHANLARQIKDEVTIAVNETLSTRTQEDKVTSTFNQYAKDHSDFDSMWESGELRRYMESNPGHNAISAHQILTSGKKDSDIQTQIDEAVAKAITDTEAKVVNNFKAKSNSRVMGDGPAGRGVLSGEDEVSAILKDTKKAGGEVAAGVKALALRRAASDRE